MRDLPGGRRTVIGAVVGVILLVVLGTVGEEWFGTVPFTVLNYVLLTAGIAVAGGWARRRNQRLAAEETWRRAR